MQAGIRKLPSKNSQNSGFTLVELLVAIGIIAVLAGLLLAGINAVTGSVATAKAGNEIATLNTALAQFHSEFGMYPPSEIVLHEMAANWGGADAATVRSRAILQKLWPNFNFSIDRDLNGNLSPPAIDPDYQTQSFHLRGAECLVFFLGGILNEHSDIKQRLPIGFSKNPTNPFDRTGANRIGPFFEIDISRLKTSITATGWYTYVDTYSGQQNPILYLSSYEGRGYRSSELAPSGMANIYYQDASGTRPWKDKTYQLISPGMDGLYGTGGHYDPSGTGTISPDDYDNITNFSSGKLK